MGAKGGGVYVSPSLTLHLKCMNFCWHLSCETEELQRDLYIDIFFTCFKKCAIFHFEQRAVLWKLPEMDEDVSASLSPCGILKLEF